MIFMIPTRVATTVRISRPLGYESAIISSGGDAYRIPANSIGHILHSGEDHRLGGKYRWVNDHTLEVLVNGVGVREYLDYISILERACDVGERIVV